MPSSFRSRMKSNRKVPPRPPHKPFIVLRRTVAMPLGILFFAFVAPEFSGMSKTWIVVWTILPLAPALGIALGAGRSRVTEALGWGMFAMLTALFFA